MSNKKKLQSFSLYINDFKNLRLFFGVQLNEPLVDFVNTNNDGQICKKNKNCKFFLKINRLFNKFYQFFKKFFTVNFVFKPKQVNQFNTLWCRFKKKYGTRQNVIVTSE